MGNAYRKSSQDTLDFIKKENSKWSRIITSIQNVPDMPWDEYIEKEMRATEEQLDRLRGKHGHQTPNAISGHEQELNNQRFQIMKLSSDRESLNQMIADLKRENKYLKWSIQGSLGIPRSYSYQGQNAQGNKTSQEATQKKVTLLQKQLVEKDDEIQIQKANNESLEIHVKFVEEEKAALLHRLKNADGILQRNSILSQKSQGNKNPHEAAQKVTQLQKQIAEKDDEVQYLKANNESLEMHVKFVEEEKAALQHRLSKVTAIVPLDNNPAISDLSDPNKPTKLEEYYAELYENEWTNSFYKMCNSGSEEDVAAETLQLTLMDVFKFCEMKAGMVLKQATDAVNLLFEEYKQFITELPIQSASAKGKVTLKDRWKAKNPDAKADKAGSKRTLMTYGMVQGRKKERVKTAAESKLIQLRKEIAVSMVPIVQEAYMEVSWDSECLEEMKPFLMKCLYLSWMMVVQSPPMAFALCKTGDRFDKTKFREYTKSGSVVASMVWPALLLQKDGPIVVKGVAQAK